jgi:hypothetical protein
MLIKLFFSVRLTSFPEPNRACPSGPIFSRFVPDGEADAVYLTADGAPHEIRVWFARSAKLQGGLLTWHLKGTEFDPTLMRRQGKLDAGWLFGKMNMPVSDSEFAALQHSPKATPEEFGDVTEDADYVALAKRLIRTLQPRLAAFVSTLRCQYGQYWLEAPRPWDSRSETLGAYCSGQLQLRWWYEEKKAWYWFLPTRCGFSMVCQILPQSHFDQYLTEADWRRLQGTRCLDDVPTEMQLLANADKSLDSGDYRQAFVEVCSALELTISGRLASENDVIKRAISSFLDGETRKAHVAVVLLLIGASEHEIQNTLKAVEIRNRVVHDGYIPGESDGRILREVVQAIRKIGNFAEIKSPTLDSGTNMLFTP